VIALTAFCVFVALYALELIGGLFFAWLIYQYGTYGTCHVDIDVNNCVEWWSKRFKNSNK
jgi:uncharacterized membrane protein